MVRKNLPNTNPSSYYLQKEIHIHISDWDAGWEQLDPDETDPNSEVQIPTRSWRIVKTVGGAADIGGGEKIDEGQVLSPEDTDDESYLRRHKKFELVERRLVRWEMNRRKYEKQLEKYHQKEEERVLRVRSWHRKKSKGKKLLKKSDCIVDGNNEHEDSAN